MPSPGPAPFFFYLRSSFNILAERAPHAHTHTEGERERERDGGRERERMAGVRFLLGPRPNPRFLPRPLDVLVEQIFRRPRSSFAEEQTPPPLVRARERRPRGETVAPLIVLNAIDISILLECITKMLAGNLTDQAIFVKQRGHRLPSSGQGRELCFSLPFPAPPPPPPLVFECGETLKLPAASRGDGRSYGMGAIGGVRRIMNRRLGSRRWGSRKCDE